MIPLRQQAGEPDGLEGGEVGPPVRVLEADPPVALALLRVHVQDRAASPAAAAGVVLARCSPVAVDRVL